MRKHTLHTDVVYNISLCVLLVIFACHTTLAADAKETDLASEENIIVDTHEQATRDHDSEPDQFEQEVNSVDADKIQDEVMLFAGAFDALAENDIICVSFTNSAYSPQLRFDLVRQSFYTHATRENYSNSIHVLLSVIRDTTDVSIRAGALFLLGSAWQSIGNIDKASHYISELVEVYENGFRYGDWQHRSALSLLGNLHTILNQPEQALPHYQRLYELSESEDDRMYAQLKIIRAKSRVEGDTRTEGIARLQTFLENAPNRDARAYKIGVRTLRFLQSIQSE